MCRLLVFANDVCDTQLIPSQPISGNDDNIYVIKMQLATITPTFQTISGKHFITGTDLNDNFHHKLRIAAALMCT